MRIILRDKWYTLRLKHRREYIERFRNLRWREVHIKYVNDRFFVSIVFEHRYKPYVPRGIVTLDINLKTITMYDGSKVRRFRTRFVDALSKKKQTEELQKRYSKRWRYNEKILNRVRELHRRARNIVVGWR